MALENILPMAVGTVPDMYGNTHIMTHQRHGERVNEAELREELSYLPPEEREKTIRMFLLGEKIGRLFTKFTKSYEYKAMVKHLRKHGNGSDRPGSIDDLFVINAGEGMVAATMPGRVRSNMIINADYIDKYCIEESAKIGESYDFVLEKVLGHEIFHSHYQTESEVKSPKVEVLNDLAYIKFQMDLANETGDKKYIDNAQWAAGRYGGRFRKKLDKYIANHTPKQQKLPEEQKQNYFSLFLTISE